MPSVAFCFCSSKLERRGFDLPLPPLLLRVLLVRALEVAAGAESFLGRMAIGAERGVAIGRE